MKYARISSDNIVIEVFTPQTGFTLAESFHPDFAELFELVPEYVEPNWIKQTDGTFVAE